MSKTRRLPTSLGFQRGHGSYSAREIYREPWRKKREVARGQVGRMNVIVEEGKPGESA